MKKRILATLLVTVMAATLFAGCGSSSSNTDSSDSSDNSGSTSDSSSSDAGYKIAMITDSGDITDESFNQTTYEASKEFAEENGLDFKYYKPTADSTDARVASTEQAIDDGYNIIVMPGYLFAGTVVQCAKDYPDVKFIVLDCSKGDLLEAALGDEYDYTPTNWVLADYVDMSNIYCAIYQEELAGYMAGYAAVKLGYTQLGFMGGMEVPAVQRYGYGFIQGADDAATELGVDVTVQYAYSGTFGCDNKEVIAACDTMYSNGCEVIFACGGSVYKDVCTSAAKNNAKIIGVDSDQASSVDSTYGEGMTVTSAMKSLQVTVLDTLDEIVNNGNWANYAGKIDNLGMVSGTDPSANYVQLPESTQWSDSFTEDDYKGLVSKMFDGKITVSNDTSALPETETVVVKDLGTILS
jgi:basic membrane protein A